MSMHRCVKLSPFSRWIIMPLLRRTCSESGTRCCQDLVDCITAECEHRALRERLIFFATVCFVKKIKEEFCFKRSLVYSYHKPDALPFQCAFCTVAEALCWDYSFRERDYQIETSLRMKLLYCLLLNRRGGLVSGFRAVNAVSNEKKTQLSQVLFMTRRACSPINSPSSPPSATPLLSSVGVFRLY